MAHKLIGFVDGENLVHRYQDMVKAGHKPANDVVHLENTLVWHPQITRDSICDIVRMYFYQTVVGDQKKLNEANKLIKDVQIQFTPDANFDGDEEEYWGGSLYPKTFKKDKSSTKTKSVDINLTIDMLRHAANDKFDILYILSGDGDYLPLVNEVARMGKQVWVGAFSKGLNEQLKYAADEFFNLDEYFFRVEDEAEVTSSA